MYMLLDACQRIFALSKALESAEGVDRLRAAPVGDGIMEVRGSALGVWDRPRDPRLQK